MAEGISAAPGSRIGTERVDGPQPDVARNVETAVRRVKEKALEVKDRLSQKSIGELVDDSREYVRENPGKTILISIGVGALVGYMIGRRRS